MTTSPTQRHRTQRMHVTPLLLPYWIFVLGQDADHLYALGRSGWSLVPAVKVVVVAIKSFYYLS